MINNIQKSPKPIQEPASSKASAILEGDDASDPDPSTSSSFPPTELNLLKIFEKVFRSHYQSPQDVDFSDDCASFGLSQAQARVVVTSDAIIEGTHFDCAWDSYEEIGAQAAVVNLSDLASCAAQPRALFWSLSLPPQLTLPQIEALATGFEMVASQYQVPVLGGNTAIREGKLEIHVTAIGEAYPQVISRQGAQAHDLLYVTGELGSRALGYLDPKLSTRQKRHQWRPHLEQAQQLRAWGKVTAMMDISDGLLLDAQRLAQLNQIHIDINLASLPIDPELQEHPLITKAALSGGEDYILLFTAPPDAQVPAEINAYCIGCCYPLHENQAFTNNTSNTESTRISNVESNSRQETTQQEKTQVTVDGQYIQKLGHLYSLEGQNS